MKIANLTVAALALALAVACGGGGDKEKSAPSGTVVNITATDGDKYQFVLDKKSVPAGEVSFVVANKGKLEHELMVYSQQDLSHLLKEMVAAVKAGEHLSHSSQMIQGLVKDAAGEDELVVEPGKSGKFTVKLTPGTYELGCLIVETIGAETIDHHGKGMHTTLMVE